MFKNKWVKIFIGLMILGAIGNIINPKEEQPPTPAAAPQVSVVETVANVTKLDAAQSEALKKVLAASGVAEADIAKIRFEQNIGGMNVYSVKPEGYFAPLVIGLEEDSKAVRFIKFDGTNNVIYATGNEAVKKIADEGITDEVARKLMQASRDAVRKNLANPDSADFPLADWSLWREDGKIVVKSTVTAKNAAGAEITSPFVATFEGDTLVGLDF